MAENNILSDIGSQLSGIKAQIQQEGLSSFLKSTLVQNQAVLEEWYSKILAQKGILSPEEKIQLENDLETAKKKALAASAKSNIIKTAFIAGGILLFVITVVIIIKSRRNNDT